MGGNTITPLIDADVLLHEIGWSGEFKDKETGEFILFDFDHVEELLNKKIEIIMEDVGATEPPILFVSDMEWLAKKEGREFIPGFRYSVAKTKPYKGNRNNPKPFHFYNILVYMISQYRTVVAKEGLEADDAICQWQLNNTDTVICSRDKDLRISPGWHYSWECGKQAAVGPVLTDELGWLDNSGEKFIGYGKAFFYYQMLVGDSADNIPGCPGIGHVKALKLLEECKTEEDYFNVVKEKYKEVLGDESKDYFMEQANLLWMCMDGPYKLPKFK